MISSITPASGTAYICDTTPVSVNIHSKYCVFYNCDLSVFKKKIAKPHQYLRKMICVCSSSCPHVIVSSGNPTMSMKN